MSGFVNLSPRVAWFFDGSRQTDRERFQSGSMSKFCDIVKSSWNGRMKFFCSLRLRLSYRFVSYYLIGNEWLWLDLTVGCRLFCFLSRCRRFRYYQNVAGRGIDELPPLWSGDAVHMARASLDYYRDFCRRCDEVDIQDGRKLHTYGCSFWWKVVF